MGKIDNIIPIFYVRGYNPPYTEAHIEVVRSIVKALLLKNIRSVVFNYKYSTDDQNAECTLKNREDAGAVKFEQHIPLIDREDLFHRSIKPKIVYASLMETLATPRFLSIERCMSGHGRCVVNIINCFKYPRIFAKRFSALPIVFHFYKRNMIMENMMRFLVDNIDMIVASSKSLAYHVETKYNVSRMKIEVIYPPVDTKVYKPIDKNESRAKLGLQKEAKIILYMGNLRTSRFPEEIVLQVITKLVKECPDTKLLIFSPRTYENIKRKLEILAKTKRLNLTANVRINVKNLSEEEKIGIYSGSDIFLYPSLTPTAAIEPPLTILEAMASGLPVISNDIPSIKEVVTDRVNGLIFPFRNGEVALLEERISSLLRDNNVITELSYNARQNIVKKLSLDNSCRKLVEIYRNLNPL